ncbi:hypothetical protein [Pararhodospirillum photometricum]|uniref:hypothetical protein n=1 Tax=Pararhodospirillum photometricum TaxID=1084 RepID=UPI0002FABCF9|nr:hypothetical protein [Pararhodospirillum photometricum]
MTIATVFNALPGPGPTNPEDWHPTVTAARGLPGAVLEITTLGGEILRADLSGLLAETPAARSRASRRSSSAAKATTWRGV